MNSMKQWLVPVDGSGSSLRALELAIREGNAHQAKPKLHILNVQSPLSGDVSRFFDGKTLENFHREEGEKAMTETLALLQNSGLEYQQTIEIGSVAFTIAEFAAKKGWSMIVMGSQGNSTLTSMLMGSIVTKVLHQTDLPVLLAR